MLGNNRTVAVVVIVCVWGFAGALFGALFAGLYQVLAAVGFAEWRPLVYACVFAATTIAAFYSAMPIALVGATAGVVASIANLIASGQKVELLAVVGLAGLAGLLAGSFYDWTQKHDGRPLTEALVGLLSGLLAGGVLTVVSEASDLSNAVVLLAAGVVAIVGTCYQLSQRWVVPWLSKVVPGDLSTPLVAAFTAVVVGVSIWILEVSDVATIGFSRSNPRLPMLTTVPQGLLGGLIGGMLTGLLLEFWGFRLEDRDD